MMRSYHPENSCTHQNTELKPDWACLVLTWVTSGESQVTHCLLFLGAVYDAPWSSQIQRHAVPYGEPFREKAVLII